MRYHHVFLINRFSQVSLLQPKPFRLVDSESEFSRELLVAFVGRQVKAVEASVAARKRSLFSHLLNAELL
jgi:hypothetical protein